MGKFSHGSSQWGVTTSPDVLKDDFYKYDLIIGNVYDPDTGPTDGLLTASTKRHLMSFAPTRSGKGVSMIIPNLLSYAGSAIVIDPKGENAWITAKLRRETLLQNVIILDPWGEVNRRYGDLAGELETVSHFNPLTCLDPESPHYADDIAYLADAIIINQGKDPHFDNSARELVAGVISYVVEEDKETATLPLVRLLLSRPAEEIAGLARDAQKFGPESVAARKLGRFVVAGREISSIISTALTQTAFLDSKTLSENLSKTDFELEDLVSENGATLYLVLPVDKLQTYGRWLRLIVSLGIRTVARTVHKLKTPVLFMLDEFGTIGRLSAVAQAYGLMAGLQMTMWAFVQDLTQIQRDYPEDWETFIANSQAVTFFNVMDQKTAEYVSRMVGTETVEIISQATAKEREGGIFKSGDPNFGRMDDKQFARALRMPEEVRNTRADLGYLLSRWYPQLFIKIVYHDNPIFLKRARLDPHFPEMAEKIKEAEEEYFKAQAEAEAAAKLAAKKEEERQARAQARQQAINEGKDAVKGAVKGLWKKAKDTLDK